MSGFKRYTIDSNTVVQICKNTERTLMDFEPIIIKNEILWLKKQERDEGVETKPNKDVVVCGY